MKNIYYKLIIYFVLLVDGLEREFCNRVVFYVCSTKPIYLTINVADRLVVTLIFHVPAPCITFRSYRHVPSDLNWEPYGHGDCVKNSIGLLCIISKQI